MLLNVFLEGEGSARGETDEEDMLQPPKEKSSNIHMIARSTRRI
jgi:hypothetical protein